MAVYRGKIDIVNMSNITATAGVGIQSTKILYAISNSGTVPPDLVDVELTTKEGEILSFASTGSSFHVINDVLWAQQGDSQVPLSTSKDYIVGLQGWTTEVPEVGPGQYLWTKTIYYYTDGKQTITYGVFRQGQDGEQGPAGPAGASSASYQLNCNQTEILKFVDNNNNIIISPEVLTVSIWKDEPLSSTGSIQITNLDINNFVVEIYDIDTGVWYNDIGIGVITLNESSIFNIDLKRIIENGNSEDGTAASILLLNECILKISYTYYNNETEEEKRYNLTKFLNVRYGMNKDMASLSVKANGIVASMQDSKLVFNANGLTIQNGAFTIQDENGENLLYSDEGNLALKGNVYAEDGYFKGDITGASGTFSGRIEAEEGYFKGELQGASGSFSGDISAATGTIGGFIIGEDRLISQNNNIEGAPNIVLNGKEGIVEADNIILGTGAQIKEYIEIGKNVKLKKVVNDVDSFISVSSESGEILSLKADGTMKLGYGDNSIIFSGADGSIISQNYTNGLGWKISNTESIFNDVTVRGSIRASVLEYGETQAIGGALLVRPSSRIIKAELSDNSTILTLEEIKGFKVGDFCRIDIQTSNSIEHMYYEVESVNESSKTITVKGNASNSYGKPIVNFGKSGDNVGISINGSMDSSFSTPQSISVFEFDQETKIISPRIILGKLPNEKTIYGYAAGTYGLYAENVLLKGSLVTQTRIGDTSDTLYSGINTLYNQGDAPNSANSPAGEIFSNPGEILLWAGAKSDEKIDIENSNFFVDRNGNLFAGSGYFKGTIITDATITASAIETAILRGSNNEPGLPALTIEDATKGIVFTASEPGKEPTVVFEVTKDSITANVSNFNFNSNFNIGEEGSLIVPNLYVIGEDAGAALAEEQETKKAIMLDKHKISYTENFNQTEKIGTIKSYINFAEGLSFSPDGSNEILKLQEQQVRIQGENTSLYIEEYVNYNDVAQYKPAIENGVVIGYDLFIE